MKIKSISNFIANGELSDEAFNKLIDSLDIKSIPINIHNNGKFEKERDTVSLITKTYIDSNENLKLILKFDYTLYLDSQTGKVELDMDNDSGDIYQDPYNDDYYTIGDIKFDELNYFLFLDNNLEKMNKAIVEKATNYLKKNKSYKKYFKNK